MGAAPTAPLPSEATQGQARLDGLPSYWLFFLDPASLLRVQTAGLRAGQAVLQSAWKELCAQELGVDSSQLLLDGFTPGVGSSCGSRCWRRVFYDLEVSSAKNELRASNADYEFLPSLYGEPALAPEGVDFEGQRILRCRLRAPFLGRDRCVLARHPLPSAPCATALPKAEAGGALAWHVAYRKVAYYEVSIGKHQGHPEPLPCVSVGLCSPRFSRYAVARQQVGWDCESWALHSDDGQLFHGSERGFGFGFGFASPPWATFGPGDVVGCGVAHGAAEGAEDVAKSPRKIFYTLNGAFLGYAFDVEDLPWDVPLWPCVGLDTRQLLSFNFGGEPFAFDLDSISELQVVLESKFQTVSAAAEVRDAAEGEHPEEPRRNRMMPLVSQFTPRRLLECAAPARLAVFRYQRQPRWMDTVDRLVTATLLDAAGETEPRSRGSLDIV
ncbi:unnamed protein product [Effrenium voratum]|uniref:B30.2/SPRY domain-containing protein n=1 Tax=Effrenium voratum TaxID=2562239 RepID=A0AA36NJU1_9DINO|nr:unnamed protein product [Effrenium voratum]